jgi:hypothetical protein
MVRSLLLLKVLLKSSGDRFQNGTKVDKDLEKHIFRMSAFQANPRLKSWQSTTKETFVYEILAGFTDVSLGSVMNSN